MLSETLWQLSFALIASLLVLISFILCMLNDVVYVFQLIIMFGIKMPLNLVQLVIFPTMCKSSK